MTDALLGLALIVGVALIAVGLVKIYEPAAYIWVGWCIIFAAWRTVTTRRAT